MTRDPATTDQKADQKADTGPLTLPPALPEERPARSPLPWIVAAGLIVVLAIGGAVLLFTRSNPAGDQRPVEAVKGFVAAMEARDATKMLSFAEPTDAAKEIGPEVRAYMEYVEEISFKDATYTLLDNDGQRAHVRWTANMHYRVNLGDEVKVGDKPIETIFELTKFEDAWYLHNVTPPTT